jgi:hypothetical protein
MSTKCLEIDGKLRPTRSGNATSPEAPPGFVALDTQLHGGNATWLTIVGEHWAVKARSAGDDTELLLGRAIVMLA